MKKLAFFFFVINHIAIVYSQPFGVATPEFRITRLIYKNSSGEQGTTYFKYDASGYITKAIWSLDNKKRYSLNYYEHDANGNIIAAFRDFSDSLTSFEYFLYDSAGNKTEEYFSRSDGVQGKAFYEYENNRLVKGNLDKYKGWLTAGLEISYNGKNFKEKGSLIKDNTVVCNISYTYDNDENLVEEIWDFNGKWSQTFNYVYERKDLKKQYYSSPFLSVKSNYRISKEDYTFNNEIGGPSEYYYNEKGLLAKKVFTRSDSMATNTLYEYDDEGKLISSKRLYSDSTSGLFTYSYNDDSNLIMRNFYRADTLSGFESYLYNSDGELVKAYLKNIDSWLSGTINFTSDHLGNITQGEFKGEDGFNAAISFDYNKEGLISEIRWDFSFGKFQLYRFEYEAVD